MSAATKPKPKRREDRPGWMMWGIPKTLQKQFKIKCIRNGVSMRQALEGLLHAYIHDQITKE